MFLCNSEVQVQGAPIDTGLWFWGSQAALLSFPSHWNGVSLLGVPLLSLALPMCPVQETFATLGPCCSPRPGVLQFPLLAGSLPSHSPFPCRALSCPTGARHQPISLSSLEIESHGFDFRGSEAPGKASVGCWKYPKWKMH